MIKRLDKESVRLLGSTEVVTSPVSVVKELLENALDAGASRVIVKLEDSGLNLIEVTDNGCGINAESMEMLGQHHCTSKSCNSEDLIEGKVDTYGFRGEALASIASVAGQLFISSCCKSEAVGRRYAFDLETHSFALNPTAVAMQGGTIVSCRNLFQRFPVRRDYYAKSKARCRDVINQCKKLLIGCFILQSVNLFNFMITLSFAAFSICRPSCRLILKHSNASIWESASNLNIATLLALSAGPLVAASDFSHLAVKPFVQNDCSFECWLPSPTISNERTSLLYKSTSDSLIIAINDRPILDKEILSVVKKVYSDYGGKNCYPIGCIKLSIPRKCVDANVDVAKRQVFIGDGKERFVEAIEDSMRNTFLREAAAPQPNETVDGSLLSTQQSILESPAPKKRRQTFTNDSTSGDESGNEDISMVAPKKVSKVMMNSNGADKQQTAKFSLCKTTLTNFAFRIYFVKCLSGVESWKFTGFKIWT